MKLVVLVDNEVSNPSCVPAWGLSIALDLGNEVLLFDGGPSPDALARNAVVAGIDLARVTTVVVSHGHGDHVNGLTALPDPTKVAVYLPSCVPRRVARFLESKGFAIQFVSDWMEIRRGIYVSKPFPEPVCEQFLVLDLGSYLAMIVGCSHPSILSMVEEARRYLAKPVKIVIGGMHLFTSSERWIEELFEELRKLGVERIAPIHCSGSLAKEVGRKVFGEGLLDVAGCSCLDLWALW